MLVLAISVKAQLVLNEACSKNNTILFDESGETPDWIEIYNGTFNTIDLDGFYLSDDPAEPLKWQFPSIQLQADSFLLVFASNRDTAGTEVHTNFKLSRSGETVVLTDPNGFEVDRFEMPYMAIDDSYGRWPDGGDEFFFGDPTPDSSNSPSIGYNGYTPQPFVSIPSGFYNDPVTVEVSDINPNADLRVEVDGHDPDPNSYPYSGPITISQTQTLRARAFADSLLPSEIVTNTYFINNESNLPVLSISTPPEYLWDSINGIYVFGTDYDTIWPHFGANFWDDREIPVHAEYFDENGNLGFKQDLGMKIHGWISARLEPQRPFRLHARQKYGDADIDYKIFKNRPYDSFKRIIVRNSGGDFNRAHFRDALHHKVAIEQGLHVDAQAYQPAVVYLNGVYWGVMNLRERIDKYYLESLHEANPEAVDLLEQDTLPEEGDLAAYQAMHQFMMSHDMSIQGNFDQAAELIDIQNIADYFIIETYINNTDWPLANIKLWRPKTPNGKWRFILIDVDATLNIDGWVTPATNNLDRALNDFATTSSHVQILLKLLENNAYRDYFISRYADLMNTTFRRENFLDEMIKVKDRISPEMWNHFELWGENGWHFWHSYHMGELVIPAIMERPAFARQYLNDHFQLNGQVELKVNVFPENAGTIKLNTITLAEEDLPWDGIYYDGVPVELTVTPNPGFNFKFWRSLYTIDADPDQSVKYNFEVDDDIVAYFEGESEGLQFSAYPNPTDGNLKLHFFLNGIENIFSQCV